MRARVFMVGVSALSMAGLLACSDNDNGGSTITILVDAGADAAVKHDASTAHDAAAGHDASTAHDAAAGHDGAAGHDAAGGN